MKFITVKSIQKLANHVFQNHLLFFVDFGVEFGVLLWDLFDEHKTLVLCQDFKESHGEWFEVCGLHESSIECLDFFNSNTSVLGEHAEAFAVLVKFLKIHHIIVHVEKLLICWGGCEQNTGIATLRSTSRRALTNSRSTSSLSLKISSISTSQNQRSQFALKNLAHLTQSVTTTPNKFSKSSNTTTRMSPGTATNTTFSPPWDWLCLINT